jgi:hypothetical protein
MMALGFMKELLKIFGSIAQTMLSGQNHEEKPARQGFAVVSS